VNEGSFQIAGFYIYPRAMAKRLVTPSKAPIYWLLWGAFGVTAVLWTTLNDPFNAPKSWVLSIAAFWLLGWIVFQVRFQIAISALRRTTLFSFAFLFTLFIAYIATDNKMTGFFGAYQRRTGFLSYFCLTVFLLSAAYIIRINRTEFLEKISIFSGSFLGIYGLFQHFNLDITKWNNPFNSVMGTLGNPDFAAACMAIFLIICFGIIFQAQKALWLRILSAFNVLLLFLVIYFSKVRQGLLVSILGISTILIVFLYQRNKSVGIGALVASFATGVASILGMLGIGPLVHYFYKISVTFRGDYWRAGINMFRHHILFGVGLDRYGSYFRQYRDLRQVLRRGPDLVSNAAHNVPIQLAATGGIFVLVAYLIFTIFIFWRGLYALKHSTGMEQMLVATFFAAWLGYEAQSLISIDNLGIAIWGYVLGGVVIGLSIFESEPLNSQGPRAQKTFAPVVSAILTLSMLIVSVMFFKSEHGLYNQRDLRPPANQQENAQFVKSITQPISMGFKEPAFAVLIALRLAQSGDIPLAIEELKSLISNDPRNYDALKLLSEISEFQKDWQPAISARERIRLLDPYNAGNLLQLGVDYKKVGNQNGVKGIIPAINAIDPSSNEAKQALKDLG